MTRVAAVDCGTNSVKLLVADLDAATGAQRTLVRELRIVRLGHGVDRTGRLSEDALARLFAAVDEYADLVARHDVVAVRFVATSAVRDADNADVLGAGVHLRLGVWPDVATGAEEAALTFEGATRSLPGVAAPVAVLDIGGGSTEVVVGEPGRVDAACSLDIGSVRLTERLMPSDPPTPDEVASARAVVDTALRQGVALAEVPTVVGVAGTVSTVATILLGLDAWDAERVHHASFAAAEVHDLTRRLLAMTVAEREAAGVRRGRSDVIGAGALILDRALATSGAERLTVSVADLLDGIAWSMV